MNPALATIMVCIASQCFNPSQVTYMETQNISGSCNIYFHRNTTITIEGKSCEDVSRIVNEKLAKQSAK